MRWLFLFVLSLNLAYVGLEMSRSTPDGHETVPALKNVPPIVLLSELKSQSGSQQVAENIELAADDGVTGALPAGRGASDSASDSVSDPEPVQVEVEPAGVEQVVVANADSVQAVAVPQESIEPQEPMPAPVESLPAENVAAESPASAGQEVSVKSSALVPQKSASCFTLGPFRDLSKLRSLTREIKSYVVEADFRGREEKEPTLYWVYLKPEKNRKQAIKTGKRLKAKKIKDFYVIREGEKINGLSLGYFRNKKSAYRLSRKVKNMGFDVVVEQVFRSYTIYWLDYKLAAGVIIPESVFEKYTRSSKKEKITRLSRDCDE